MAVININSAMRMFKYSQNATKWVPKQNFKNATVVFEKKFVTGENGEKILTGIDKVVTRADGQVVRGHYTTDGLLTGSLQKSSSGTIETNFGCQNYDKITTITTSAGDTITRLGHKGRPQSFIDSYHPKNGIPSEGNYSDAFNRLKAIVQNPKKYPTWLQDLINQWR